MADQLPNLLWVDLETTGLDPEKGKPLEIAVMVTNSDLQELYSRSWVIHQYLSVNDLDPWVLKTHAGNGLLTEVVNSTWNVERVEDEIMYMMVRRELWPSWDVQPPLCGSSIQFERLWLAKFFPRFYSQIHYRSVDVSSIKELTRRWQPEDAVSSKETSNHRAMDDIVASVQELELYRSLLWGATSPLVL